METLLINVPDQKVDFVKMFLKELGVTILEKSEKENKTTLNSMAKTRQGVGLTKTTSHSDLMEKLNA
jgi:antitoxin component of RelBE/YafQ-DinJ toxin-antitoxin module